MTEDDDSGAEFFFDLVKTLVALFCFVLILATVGGIVWGLLA